MGLVSLKAQYVLKQNIDALLKSRGYRRKDLAIWCRRTESWLSQILTKPNRNLPIHYLDRIADFFGLVAYQLFQPGMAGTAERRKGGDRRSGVDRRLSHASEMLEQAPSIAELESHIRRLDPNAYRRFALRAKAVLITGALPPSEAAPHDPRVSDARPPKRAQRTRGGQSGE